MVFTSPLDIRPEVAEALQSKRPVVAMVSVPFACTLPWPVNLETFQLADTGVRQEGALLAMVAVWRGRLTIGLEMHEIEELTKGVGVVRASRRDLAAAVVNGWNASTTVSASMYIARRAGIRLLATGAIGGATRPDEHLWDISSDMMELLHTPMAVVSAGARTVHNIAYTAEVLETFRVPVIGYRTDSFPIFYMCVGNHPITTRANTPAEVAALLNAHWGMDGAGVVIAQPTPTAAALSPDELLPALRAVENQAAADRVARRDLSPFLMERLNRLTHGKALHAYQTILVANARLAGQIAFAMFESGEKKTDAVSDDK